MPKIIADWSDRRVATVSKAGRYAVARNLYLYVSPTKADDGERLNKFWVFRYVSPLGKRRDAGMGPYPDMTLAKAKERAQEFRDILRAGGDPILARKRDQEALRASVADQKDRQRLQAATLKRMAEEFHATHEKTLRNAKHAADWLASLRNHVFTKLGDKPIGEIRAEQLLELLLPLRETIPETAGRIRQRLEAVFADAMIRGLATSNPAQAIRVRMKGRRAKAHHAALHYRDVPAFINSLREAEGVGVAARLGLEFAILTAARTGEVIGATWDEIDTEGREWVIPGSRMKGHKQHRIPLTDRAFEILEAARELGTGSYIFPSPMKEGEPLSNMAFLMLLRRMGYKERTTAHGFRSSFSTWAREQTKFKDSVIEAALAHREDDQVAAAYSRAEYLRARRALAEAWAGFVAGKGGKVIELRGRAAR